MRKTTTKTNFFCGVALLLLASSATVLIGAANSFAYDDGGKKPKIVFVTSANPGNPFYGPIIGRGAYASSLVSEDRIIKGFDQAGIFEHALHLGRGAYASSLVSEDRNAYWLS